MADDDTTNELPKDQDIDNTVEDPEADGDESSEVNAGDDALVDEGVIENNPSSEDPPRQNVRPAKGRSCLDGHVCRYNDLAHGFLCVVTKLCRASSKIQASGRIT